MRVSTAITSALTALLMVFLLGAVAAPLTVSAHTYPEYEGMEPITDGSPAVVESAALTSDSAAYVGESNTLAVSAAASAQSADSLAKPDPKQVIRLDIRDNGDVRWTVESRFLLTNESDIAVFQEYADAVTSGQRTAGYGPEQFEQFRQIAQQETGREMSIEDAHWDEPRIIDSPDADSLSEDATTTAENARIGVISYSFTWTNFATVEGDQIHFGDAFQTDHGTWIGLSEGQRLVIESPSEYALAPETSTRLTWDGPYEFAADELEIVFVRTGALPVSMSGWMLGGVLVIGVIIGVGGYLVVRRDGRPDIPADRLPSLPFGWGKFGRDTDDQSATAGNSTTTDPPSTTPRSDTLSPDRSVSGDGTGQADGTHLEFEDPDYQTVDPELLSDEERVLRLLRQNGGRMKQASIVSETGWSNAKVSQLLSKMDDDEEIEKLRIGRENLITLPGVDLTNQD